MVTLILGKTLVFWSGILLGISLFFMLSTCSFVIRLINFKAETRMKIHKYAVNSTVILVFIHATLALLSSLYKVLIWWEYLITTIRNRLKMDIKYILLIIAIFLIAIIIIWYITKMKKGGEKPKEVIDEIRKKLENCC